MIGLMYIHQGVPKSFESEHSWEGAPLVVVVQRRRSLRLRRALLERDKRA